MQKPPKITKPAFRFLINCFATAVALGLTGLLLGSTAGAQNTSATPPPPLEEPHWYTNPFYIVGGIFFLALVLQVIVWRRKKNAERNAGRSLRIVAPDTQFHLKQPLKKKGRLTKEEMSSLLKASATPAPAFETSVAPDLSPDRVPESSVASPAEPEPAEPEFRIPTATHPIETGPVINIEELSAPPSLSPLPDFADDDVFMDSLDQLQDEDVESRALAARVLGQFKTRNAVAALSFAASNDTESSVRSAAVASLGMIGHESVFPTILALCADSAPDVRLASARTLSDLKFSRAEAYTRLIAEGDHAMLRRAVAGCQQTGMTARAFDRLASPDSRQSYEAFAILSLLVKAGEIKPLFNAIAQHPAENIRLAAVKLLRNSGIPGVTDHLKQMAEQSELTPRIKAALMDDSKPPRRRNAPFTPPPVMNESSSAESAPPVFVDEPELDLSHLAPRAESFESNASEPLAPRPVFRDDPNDPLA
ncbi:MAG: HEAT repeat domain-containing protein [Pyrinomonadaceae bacterium]